MLSVSYLRHSCFALVAGSVRYPDAYVGQHCNQSDAGQLAYVS